MKTTLPTVTITTDGGCQNGTTKLGAWAAILRFGDHVKTISGVQANTTNNRMELTAIIEALRNLKKPCRVLLRTDAKYCVYAVQAFYTCAGKVRWMREGKANRDLVAELWEAMRVHQIKCKWIKGHAGDPDNNTCDRLATERMQQAKQRASPLSPVT